MDEVRERIAELIVDKWNDYMDETGGMIPPPNEIADYLVIHGVTVQGTIPPSLTLVTVGLRESEKNENAFEFFGKFEFSGVSIYYTQEIPREMLRQLVKNLESFEKAEQE